MPAKNRIKVQLTKSQFIDGVLHEVDPKGAPITLSLLETHAQLLVEQGAATLLNPPPAAPAPQQVGEPAAS
jgi:hypothetical protein